jgi:hypothetical protein
MIDAELAQRFNTLDHANCEQGGPPGQPPQGQYGAPPPQGGYGGGPPPLQQVQSSPAEVQGYEQLLQACIQEKQLQPFYPPGDRRIRQIAEQAASKVNQIIQRWRVGKEIANDIVKLALYDIVLYIGKLSDQKTSCSANIIKTTVDRCNSKKKAAVSKICALFWSESLSLPHSSTPTAFLFVS